MSFIFNLFPKDLSYLLILFKKESKSNQKMSECCSFQPLFFYFLLFWYIFLGKRSKKNLCFHSKSLKEGLCVAVLPVFCPRGAHFG